MCINTEVSSEGPFVSACQLGNIIIIGYPSLCDRLPFYARDVNRELLTPFFFLLLFFSIISSPAVLFLFSFLLFLWFFGVFFLSIISSPLNHRNLSSGSFAAS